MAVSQTSLVRVWRVFRELNPAAQAASEFAALHIITLGAACEGDGRGPMWQQTIYGMWLEGWVDRVSFPRAHYRPSRAMVDEFTPAERRNAPHLRAV